MAKKKKTVSVKPLPLTGDHGTGTIAATAGTVLEYVTDPMTGAKNPNRVGRRRRTSEIDRLEARSALSPRQVQAARAIQEAYCRVERLSSGGELKEPVDGTSRPDACIEAQVSAQSSLAYVMKKVPGTPPECRQAVEQVCWRGEPVSKVDAAKSGAHMACLKVSLDLVANHLGY